MTIIAAVKLEKTIRTLESPIDILKGVDLEVNEAESIAIVGASGSGKTTLLSLLAGLDVATKGDIFVEDQNLSKLTEDERASFRLGRIGFIFQNFELLPSLTALENVMLPMELSGHDNVKQKAISILAKVGLKERVSHYPSQLSGGEQQRVAIARAYGINPKILFADEPTGCLDTKTGDTIIKLLFELKENLKTTLVFVTHDVILAKQCNRVFMLEQGTLRRES